MKIIVSQNGIILEIQPKHDGFLQSPLSQGKLFYILIAKHAKAFAFRFEWEREHDLRVISESLA